MANAAIYGQVDPVKSVDDYRLQDQTIRGNKLALLAQQQKYDEATAQTGERNALRAALSAGLDPSTPDGRNRLYQVAPTMAPGILKTMQDQMTSQAMAAKDNAQAGHFDAQSGQIKHGVMVEDMKRYATSVMANPTLDNARQAVIKIAAQHGGDPTQDLVQLQQLGENPDAIKQWAAAHALTADRLLPSIQTRNTGATTDTLAVNPVTGVGSVTGSVKNTVSPDAQLQANTSRANNAATISAENLRAGVTPGGGLDDNSERTAQAIAKGQLQPPTGMALMNPKNQRILGRVMEINPDYDSTTVTAKKKAASDFTSGTLGNSMRSFAVAGQHLDQLGKLVDGLNNGNLQIVNQIGNAYAAQTGNPAPTNFDAAKDVVSKEVVKAIVAGGGGVAEREELSKLMSNAKSPAQLKGVIQQYRSLMGAQHDALLEQRRAAGLPDSTMPNYAGPEAPAATQAANIPPDIAAIMAKHGKPGAK